MDERHQHPPRFSLLLWQAGDLLPDEAREVEEHITACEHCRALLAEVREDVDTFEAGLPQHLARLKNRLAVEPRRREIGQRGRRWQRWAMPLLMVAVAASLMLILMPGVLDGPPTEGPQPTIRYKGSFTLQAVVKRGKEQFFAKEDIRLHPGDALAMIINTADAGYVTLFSYDSRGTLTPLVPPSEAQKDPTPHRLSAPGRHLMPGSAELDEVLGKERVVAIFSTSSFSRVVLHQRAKALLTRGEQLSPQNLELDSVISVLRFEKVAEVP
ncbi:MAG: DUF4384 domain-containing protein [Deltaproteobacteria bacterium]|nr:DUF4384 domain-containing protein [Deltaproteobacteria bacterium]